MQLLLVHIRKRQKNAARVLENRKEKTEYEEEREKSEAGLDILGKRLTSKPVDWYKRFA
jgi:hypothetical protein